MEIWEEIAADSERGTRRLIVEYGDRLFTAACQMTQNETDAEDLVFRTFSYAVRKISVYDGRSAFFSWLYMNMLNFRRMDLRRKAANALVFTGEIPECEDPTPDPAEALAVDSSRVAVRKGIGALPEELRIPLVLHYYEGLGVSQVASIVGVPVGTVKYRLFEARKRLARWLVQTKFTENAYNKTDGKRDGQVRRADR